MNWFRRLKGKEGDLDDELRFHFEEEMEGQEARGLAPEAACRAAHQDLGNLTLLKEDTRAMWTWTFWEQLLQDLRYAGRTMLANTTFTALAALSLALGIGANTAIFSFMDSILLRSLPVPNPESLVVFHWHGKTMGWRNTVVKGISGSAWGDQKVGVTSGIFPYPVFELFRTSALFETMFAYHPTRNLDVIVNGNAEAAVGEYVSGDFFRGVAVSPGAGRLITAADDREDAAAIVVLSWAFAEKHFGSAARAVGQSILINKVPFTVAGVTPPGFFGVDPSSAPFAYLPLRTGIAVDAVYSYGKRRKDYLDKHYYWLEMMARLRPGVSLTQAQAVLGPQFHQWVDSTAVNATERANLPELVLQDGAGGLDVLRRRFSKPLYVLMTLVGMILAIACANIANLLLARSTARRREIGLRLSLGAGRSRIVRQLLTESVLLSCSGGLLGVLFALWGMRFLTLLLANGDANFTLHAQVNWHVLAVAAGLSVLTGLLFGVAPALQSTAVEVTAALKESLVGRRHSAFRFRIQHVLVVTQIGMSLLMLFAAGLFVRTLSNLQSIEVGFNRENLLLFRVNARISGHRDPEAAVFYENLQRRFSLIPGVRGATLSHGALVGEGYSSTDVSIAGKPVDARYMMIGPRFFTTMQIPILAGREIDDRDRTGSQLVAVVNERFANIYFAGVNPIGRYVTFGNVERPTHELQIIGVSKDTRYGKLTEDTPAALFVAYNQGVNSLDEMTYSLRTAGDPLAYANAIREIVHQADRLLPVTKIRTQAAQIDQTMGQEIVFAKLCTAFAILALAIACVGLYGAMSYNVARRTSEIGIRMAIGARRGDVIWMVLREVMLLAGIGLLISVPCALAASTLVRSFLYAMKPNDPLALMAAVTTLVIAAIAAGYIPARKASLIDPIAALRHE